MKVVRYIFDPNGEHIDVDVGDPNALPFQAQTFSIPTSDVERIYNILRASQLGADSMGNL